MFLSLCMKWLRLALLDKSTLIQFSCLTEVSTRSPFINYLTSSTNALDLFFLVRSIEPSYQSNIIILKINKNVKNKQAREYSLKHDTALILLNKDISSIAFLWLSKNFFFFYFFRNFSLIKQGYFRSLEVSLLEYRCFKIISTADLNHLLTGFKNDLFRS